MQKKDDIRMPADPGRGVLHWIEEQAVGRPSSPAVICGGARLTYAELNQRANQLAHYLKKKGLGPDLLAAILLERSPDMLVAMLAVLKAGGAYVPLDTFYPHERLAAILKDANVAVVLTTKQWAVESAAPQVELDTEWPAITREESSNPGTEASPEHLAYVIYTSGSTGTPKGVMVTRGNLAYSTAARFSYYREPVAAFLLLPSFAFDSSVAGIYWTLSQGGALVIPPDADRHDLAVLARLISENKVSHMLCLPSLYAILLEQADARQLEPLGTVIVAGEACQGALVDLHHRKTRRVRLYNEYGPTECTVWSTVYLCEQGGGPRVSIGKEIPGTKVHVLDENLQPVETGEIHIAGPGLARGYLNREELTAKKFVIKQNETSGPERLYKTGDVGRFLPDGNIEFLGRVDQQVKIRGFRVELQEIEAVLTEHPGVRQCAVAAHEDRTGAMRLVAYIAERDQTGNKALWTFLETRLPDYMVPVEFVRLEALPLNANGKIDRKALPAPPEHAAVESKELPKNSVENAIGIIWAAVLQREQVGVHENFFEAGGDSLKLSVVHIKLCETLGKELPVTMMFEFPTISSLADALSRDVQPKATQDVARERAMRQRAAFAKRKEPLKTQ